MKKTILTIIITAVIAITATTTYIINNAQPAQIDDGYTITIAGHVFDYN